MKSWKYCLVLFGVLVLKNINATASNFNEDEARTFTQDASKALYNYYDKLATDTFGPENLPSFVNLFDTLMIKSDILLNISSSLSQFDQTSFKDMELSYIFDRLKKLADVSVLGADRYFEILSASYYLNGLGLDEDIAAYKNPNNTLAYLPEIQKIFETSKDPEEMKYYWNEWRKKNKRWVKNWFVVLVNGIKDAANITGISASEFWMRDFNMTQMDAVMAQLEPAYRQIHAFVRHRLNKKYGDTVINNTDLIPEHLFQQVLAQIFTTESILEDIFPHKDLPRYEESLAKNSFDTLKIFKTADKFYESMGFEQIPESYWGKNLKMKIEEEEADCKTTILAETKNVFMQYCNKVDFKTFLQAHGYMAELHMAIERADLPAYYADSYNLDYAIGEAVILSASSPKHLNKIGLIEPLELSEQAFMNRLLRLSFHTMLNVPVHYVHTKVMSDLFAGKFEMEALNKKYWELMDKYVGVGPPKDRVSTDFDFPLKFYLDFTENLQSRKFTSEVLGFQFYTKLCSITDPKGYLQNCDLSESTAAGDALKKMIKLGSSKPFPEVLASLLPEDPKLNAESLLEYYYPALNWVSEANKQSNVNFGWNHLDRI